MRPSFYAARCRSFSLPLLVRNWYVDRTLGRRYAPPERGTHAILPADSFFPIHPLTYVKNCTSVWRYSAPFRSLPESLAVTIPFSAASDYDNNFHETVNLMPIPRGPAPAPAAACRRTIKTAPRSPFSIPPRREEPAVPGERGRPFWTTTPSIPQFHAGSS